MNELPISEVEIKWIGTASEEQMDAFEALQNNPLFAGITFKLIGGRPKRS